MSLKDSSDEKWNYTDHAKVKHILLEKYLKGWIVIIGKYSDKIAYFDGFAGRGKYTNGDFGSPILAMKAFQDVANVATVKNLTYNCVFIENDSENFKNLEETIKNEKHKYPAVNSIQCQQGDFNTIINEILDEIKDKLVPSFFFIDPFGYTGVPFSTIKRILDIPKTEVFFNFMVRDINRFLSLPNQEDNLNGLFGDGSWKDYINLHGDERQNALRDLYISKLLECSKYAWPFKICEDERSATLYHLIYATNSFKGLDIMKSIMFNQNEHFAYLGPEEYKYQNARNQLRLFDFNTIDLKKFLIEYFPSNTRKTYEHIKENTYLLTPCIDKHYRAALKDLEKEGSIRVKRVTSGTTRGLSGNDLITFK